MHRNTRTHHSSSQTMPTSAIIDALDSPDAPLKATALATTLLVVKHILTVAVQVRVRNRDTLGDGSKSLCTTCLVSIACAAATLPHPTNTQTHQGGARFESGRRPPEDAPLMPKAGAQDFTGAAKAGGKGSDSPALKAAIEVGVWGWEEVDLSVDWGGRSDFSCGVCVNVR